MDEKQKALKQNMRIAALEYFVQHLLWIVAKSTSENPIKMLKEYRERIRLEMDESFVPRTDPISSDVIMQEYSEAVYKLIDDLILRLEKEAQ